ncbi:DUF2071 domain-containing protein [Micromonospora sp. LOL_014]|uniref:DUF2071 domain-containing protein n=1 Tax=Micromonospora sp. LOL_014 TaxID=3345415 RepID=UPI003A83575F
MSRTEMPPPEPVTVTAPRPVLVQGWHDLAFLHWPVDPAVVAPLLPPGTRVGVPIAEPTPLEHFLTARWGLHERVHGATRYLPNEHPQWPSHRAELVDLADDLVAAGGLPAPDGPPVSVLYSPGVPVRSGRPVTVTGHATRDAARPGSGPAGRLR